MQHVLDYGPMLLDGLLLTVGVGVLSMALAIVVGIGGAAAKTARSPVSRWLAATYTTVVRGVPELVMILLVYYGVPTLIMDIAGAFGASITINLNPFAAGVLTIAFIYGAFTTEVFRAAYLAVPRGQVEAALACGMTGRQAAWRVTLPQMWRFALPGLGNVWLTLLKATALISIIQLEELMRNAQIAAQATREPFTYYFIASLLYLVLTAVSMTGQQALERHANRGIQRA